MDKSRPVSKEQAGGRGFSWVHPVGECPPLSASDVSEADEEKTPATIHQPSICHGDDMRGVFDKDAVGKKQRSQKPRVDDLLEEFKNN